jgi:hypothetical protein
MKEWNSFTERLHFVNIDGRVFAIMAYNSDDAWRQVRDALFIATFGPR